MSKFVRIGDKKAPSPLGIYGKLVGTGQERDQPVGWKLSGFMGFHVKSAAQSHQDAKSVKITNFIEIIKNE